MARPWRASCAYKRCGRKPTRRTRAHDTAWLQRYYGLYLSQVLWIRPHLRTRGRQSAGLWLRPGDQSTSSSYTRIAPGLRDLLEVVREQKPAAPGYGFVETEVRYGRAGGEPPRCRRRSFDPRPAGDRRRLHHRSRSRGYGIQRTGPTCFWSPSIISTRSSAKTLGKCFGFANLHWLAGPPPSRDSTEPVKGPQRRRRWNPRLGKDRPGLEFVRRVAPGLGLALILIATLTYLLILWATGRRNGWCKVRSTQRLQRAPTPLLSCRTGWRCTRCSGKR